MGSSEMISTGCEFIVPLLLEYVCGELDHSMDFFQSTTWTTGSERARIYLANAMDAKEKNAMTTEEAQSVMQTFSPPISDDENIDSSDFWDRFEKEHFESIWYYLSEHINLDYDYYGEFQESWWFVGVLNSKKIKAASGKKIYCKVHLKCHSVDLVPQDYKLLFEFSDSNETFWMKVINREYLMTKFGSAMKRFQSPNEL